MENIILYIIIGVLAVGIIGFLTYKIGKVIKMKPEERKQLLITFLKGLVAQAEQHIGSGHGAEKLEEVEKYFQEKAPFLYKMCLRLVGKDNLKELIETALKEIKDSFEK
jgi:hypothetical protein